VRSNVDWTAHEYSPDPLSLPDPGHWGTHFPSRAINVRERVSIRNPQTAAELVNAFLNSDDTRTSEPKVVIEAYPGTCFSGYN
jgi:transcription factor 1